MKLNIWQYLLTLRRGRRRQVYKMMPEILVIFLSNFWIYSCEILLLQSLKLNGGASSALVLLSSPLLKDLDVRSKRKTVVVVSFCCSFFRKRYILSTTHHEWTRLVWHSLGDIETHVWPQKWERCGAMLPKQQSKSQSPPPLKKSSLHPSVKSVWDLLLLHTASDLVSTYVLRY